MYPSWMISSHLQQQTIFLSQGRSCFIYPIFIQLKSISDIKNVFFKGDFVKRVGEIGINIT